MAISGTNDPDGKIAKENAERKAKENREKEEKVKEKRDLGWDYMDFNIKNPDSIWHEYAGAIHDASSKGKILAPAYTGDKSAVVSFSIPVYKNTGAATVLPEKSGKRNNYYFSSLTVSGLTPSYSMTDFRYKYRL